MYTSVALCSNAISGLFSGPDATKVFSDTNCVLISDSLFTDVSRSSSGGAIFVHSTVLKFSSLNNNFFRCSSTSLSDCWGGAAYIGAPTVYVYRNCFKSCVSYGDCHSIYMSDFSDNKMESTSIIFSGSETPNQGKHNSMDFSRGTFNVKSLNSSHNMKGDAPGFYCLYCTNSRLSFSNIGSNRGTNRRIIHVFNQQSHSVDFSNVNIVNNSVTADSSILIETLDGRSIFRDCFIVSNMVSTLVSANPVNISVLFSKCILQELTSSGIFASIDTVTYHPDMTPLALSDMLVSHDCHVRYFYTSTFTIAHPNLITSTSLIFTIQFLI